MKHLKRYKLFESTESTKTDLELMIRDVLADATDEGIKLSVRQQDGDWGSISIHLASNHPSTLEVILYKLNFKKFILKDIKSGVDSLLSMLGDEYELIRVFMVDDQGKSHKFNRSHGDPWENLQLLIKDNSFQRTYPDKDFPLNAVKLMFNNLKSDV